MSKEKDQSYLLKEISELKQEIKEISHKVDLTLEILNNFTLMLTEEEDEQELDDYDTDESWVPKEEDFWEEDNGESF